MTKLRKCSNLSDEEQLKQFKEEQSLYKKQLERILSKDFFNEFITNIDSISIDDLMILKCYLMATFGVKNFEYFIKNKDFE